MKNLLAQNVKKNYYLRDKNVRNYLSYFSFFLSFFVEMKNDHCTPKVNRYRIELHFEVPKNQGISHHNYDEWACVLVCLYACVYYDIQPGLLRSLFFSYFRLLDLFSIIVILVNRLPCMHLVWFSYFFLFTWSSKSETIAKPIEINKNYVLVNEYYYYKLTMITLYSIWMKPLCSFVYIQKLYGYCNGTLVALKLTSFPTKSNLCF